jgi:RNA polymerase sigma-70 factor (ECF subfamily)
MATDTPSLAEDDPVAVALADQTVVTRLQNAARAFFGSWGAHISRTERDGEIEVILQEVRLRALRHRERFDPSKDIVTWLVGFVRNVARERARERSRLAAGLHPDGPELETLAIDRSRMIDDAVADQLTLNQLLEPLPAIERDILLMKYRDEMTFAEVGQRLGMRENAVRIRAFRALQKVRATQGFSGEGQP